MLQRKHLSENSSYQPGLTQIVDYFANLSEKHPDLNNYELKNQLIDKLLSFLVKYKMEDSKPFVALKKKLNEAKLLKPFEEIIDRTMLILLGNWLHKTCVNINKNILSTADQDFPMSIKLLLKSLKEVNTLQAMVENLRELYMDYQDNNKKELPPQERRFMDYEYNLASLDRKIRELIRDLLPKILEEQRKLNEMKEREKKEMDLQKVEDDLLAALNCSGEDFDIGNLNDLINKYNQNFFKVLYQIKKPELEQLTALSDSFREKLSLSEEDRAELVSLLKAIEEKMNKDSYLLHRVDQLNKLIEKRKIEISDLNYKNRIGLNELYLNTLAQRSANLHEAYRQTDTLADHLDRIIRPLN